MIDLGNLENEIKEYCELNNINDVNKFIISLIQNAFTVEKYGITPPIIITKPKVEIEEPLIIEKKIKINFEDDDEYYKNINK